jgi:hypothetical protein
MARWVLPAGALGLLLLAAAVAGLRSAAVTRVAPIGRETPPPAARGAAAIPVTAPGSPADSAPPGQPPTTAEAPAPGAGASQPATAGADAVRATPPPAGAAAASAAEEAVVGASPYPAGGKPTGPFDLAWNLVRRDALVTGSITVRNLSATAPVEVSFRALGDATLESPAAATRELARGASGDFPVTVRLASGAGSLVVTAAHLAVARRARIITIPLAGAGAAAAPGTTGVVAPDGAAGRPGDALTGSRTIVDDAGQRIELHPAAPAK